MTLDNKGVPAQKQNSPIAFGWKHLLIRVIVILIISSTISFLQFNKTIDFHIAEANLIVPAIVGLAMAIMNWRFIIKIAIIIMPIWFAAALAIFFAGTILVELADLQITQNTNSWIAMIIKYLPPAIAGHWLYSGYSRMAKSKSIFAYFLIVVISILIALFVYADYDIFILQTVYLTGACFALNIMHLNKISVGVKADKKIAKPNV